MIEDMYAVMQRINEIKKRFGVRHAGVVSKSENSFQSRVEQNLGEPGNSRGVSGDAQAARVKKAAANGEMSLMQLKSLAREYAARKRVPGDLVDAVIKTESSYNPRAVSNKGAKGLMQLMPETIKAMRVDDPFSAEENVSAGVSLLKTLLDKYNWDYKKALAAYNAGEGAVDRSGGVPPIQETVEYVRRVIDQYQKNSEAE